MRSNDQVASALARLALLTQLEEGSRQSFRTRAYERAVDAVSLLPEDVSTLGLSELRAIDGVGDSTAKKIREFIDTGRIQALDELTTKYPDRFVAIMQIPGVGPRTAITLRDELGIESVDQLKEAVTTQQLRELPGFGAKTEEKIGKAIDRLGLAGKDRRLPIGKALRIAEGIVDRVESIDGVTAAVPCGSLRRFRDTIADVDILVVTGEPVPVIEAFVGDASVRETLGAGAGGASVTTDDLQIDLRVVPLDQFGSASLYFTGSKAHNIALRQRAIERGWLLNEYGLMDGDTVVASTTEEEIYRALDLDFIPPELREDVGEIEAAAEGSLPDLVGVEDIRGDLHVHSAWSGDGRSSLEHMIEAAAGRGLEYLAITEHAEDLAINGLSREKVVEQRARIEEIRARYPDLVILHGAELNIGRDGDVDYDAEFLAEFDWCVASVHSHFDLSTARQTDRVIKAVANPAVNVVGHLTGRRIGRRPGIEIDFDAVLDAVADTGTALEINSHIDRLDVPADLLLRARHRDDVVFTISTDAHHTTEFANIAWGVRTARRGWVERSRVLNTRPAADFLSWLG
ncbi:MAG: DNA polymerase/3'-5' exonuclease PolX [Acidimicrobiia bacterium]|nr:MAG: DNA polymerase/3'-5' exonuclease PolX [Acidimicrobiia bacterium]